MVQRINSVAIGQYRLFVGATMVGMGALSVVANSRGVQAVAMVIFRTSGVTYIRRIGHARDSF